MADLLSPSDPSAEWAAGWWVRARQCRSPNYGPRPAGSAITLALIHSVSLPPGEYGGDGVERLFTNRLDWDAHPYYQGIRGMQVSSHFFIRRDGQAVQFVSCDDRAWHAGRSHWQGQDDCNDFSVGIELEGFEGSSFECAQYNTLVDLMRALAAHYPVRQIAGHEHVAPGRKADPGPGFDWRALQAALQWPNSAFAALAST